MQEKLQAERLKNISQKFEKSFGNLSFEQLNTKPSPEKWSIAQNIEHLIKVNDSYFPVIAELRAGTYKPYFLAKIPIIVNMFGKLIYKSVLPENTQKIKTFPIWEAEKSNISPEILQNFLTHQIQLAELILSCEDLVKKKTVIASPANHKIVYYLETAFEIIIAHEERHFEQAEEIKKNLFARTP
jgi:hypothetical protein